MQIDISKVEQKLALLASSEGFENVEAYVTQPAKAGNTNDFRQPINKRQSLKFWRELAKVERLAGLNSE